MVRQIILDHKAEALGYAVQKTHTSATSVQLEGGTGRKTTFSVNEGLGLDFLLGALCITYMQI